MYITLVYRRLRRKYVNARNALALAFLSRVDVSTAAATSAAGTAIAAVGGYDPWTWVIGGLGAAIVYIKKEVTSRMDAITNSAISVSLAGIVSPELTAYAVAKFSIPITSPYPLAFMLSATWPWIIPAMASIIKVNVK